MHARIATARTAPESADEVERIWRSLLKRYQQTGAFLGMLAMYDSAEDVAVTVTLWASDREADEAAAALRPLAASAFEGVLLEPPTIKQYDALVSEVRSRP
jgi:hypothetical protein